jgi:Ran-binding protein 1
VLKLSKLTQHSDANLFKDAFIKAQKENEALFQGASAAPAETAEEKKEDQTEEKKEETS